MTRTDATAEQAIEKCGGVQNRERSSEDDLKDNEDLVGSVRTEANCRRLDANGTLRARARAVGVTGTASTTGMACALDWEPRGG